MSYKHESLTQENNFWRLYLITRKIPDSKDNIFVFLISYIFLLSLSYYGFDKENLDPQDVKNGLKLLLATSISVMAFILTGYAIFATLTDKELQYEMSIHIEPKTNLSFLKYSHCIFIRILIDLILLAFIAILMLSLLEISAAGKLFEVKRLMKIFIEPLIYSLMLFILMLCKSFIYNVYHSIMTSIRWYAENHEKTSKQK